MKRRAWAEKEIRALSKLYPCEPTSDVAAALRRSMSAVNGMAYTLGLRKTARYLASPEAHRFDGRKGIGTRWAKGHTPWNKGMKGWRAGGRSAETRFKPGNVSRRWDPEIYIVGALRINSDGGLDIKLRHGARGWYSMARWTWETERGPTPKGGVVRPINGDTHDTRIENLRLGMRRDLMRENTLHNYPKPIACAIQLRGALNRRINRMEKERGIHP